jgi:hypothetical protein
MKLATCLKRISGERALPNPSGGFRFLNAEQFGTILTCSLLPGPPSEGQKTEAQWAPYFTASGLRSTPSHRNDGPNGLPPKQPPALDARSTCRGPTHTGLQSSANNRLSKCIPDLARRVSSLREPRAEPELPRPPAWLDHPSLLLLAWWWSSSPSLVPQRSRPVQMSPTSIDKSLFSYMPSSFRNSFCARRSALSEMKPLSRSMAKDQF